MFSGPVIIMCLSLSDHGDNVEHCFSKFRNLMIKEGGIRDKFGQSKRKNAIHGSDSEINAECELNLFFK